MEMMSYDCSASTLLFAEVPESNTEASCRPKLQLQHWGVAADSSTTIKGCRQTEQLLDIRGKTSEHFLCKI